MCAVVVFEVEKVIELFWSVGVECKKVVKTENRLARRGTQQIRTQLAERSS